MCVFVREDSIVYVQYNVIVHSSMRKSINWRSTLIAIFLLGSYQFFTYFSILYSCPCDENRGRTVIDSSLYVIELQVGRYDE